MRFQQIPGGLSAAIHNASLLERASTAVEPTTPAGVRADVRRILLRDRIACSARWNLLISGPQGTAPMNRGVKQPTLAPQSGPLLTSHKLSRSGPTFSTLSNCQRNALVMSVIDPRPAGPPNRIGCCRPGSIDRALVGRRRRGGTPSSSTSVRSDNALSTSAQVRGCGSSRGACSSFPRTRASGGMSRLPTTTRSGTRRQREAVGQPRGRTVVGEDPVPTRSRRRWRGGDADPDGLAGDPHWLEPSAAALRPSMLVAYFQVTCGEPVRCLWSHSRSPATTCCVDCTCRRC